jgi:signal peptidase I
MTYEVNRRPLFEESTTEEMWVEGKSKFDDTKVLLTISSALGEKTVLITQSEIIETKSKLFVQAPPERILTKASKRSAIFGRGSRFVGYALSAILLTFSVLSAAGFVKARIVLTASMEPMIHSGDIVVLAPTPRSQPKIGDVVAYTARRFDGEVVGTFTHRIIGGDPVNGFLVKGDNNPAPDVQKPKSEDVSGIVFLVIPLIGKILAPKVLLILVPIGVGIWMILDTLKSEP